MSSRGRRGNHEGKFWTRPDGRIQYQVMVDGHRITTYGRTKSEAKRKATERVSSLGTLRSTITLAGLLERWEAVGYAELGLAPTTFDQYRSLIRTRAVPLIGSKRVDTLTKAVMVDVMNRVGGTASTRRSRYAALVRLIEYARTQGFVGVNVMRQIDRPQRATAAPRDISDAEALRLLQAARGHRWEVASWLGLGAGLRRGEMLGLRWDDVNFEDGTISVTGNVTRSKSAGLRRGDPKTRRGKRIVPVPPEVVLALKRHRKLQAEEQLAAGSMWTSSGHVVTNEIGGVAEPRKLSRTWHGWAVEAEVSDTGTHAGRHFAASTLVASGLASVADIAAMLGHDPAVLLTTYAVAVADGQRAAAAALGGVLTKSQATIDPR